MLGIGGITDNSLAEVNENTVGQTRFTSQITQDIYEEKNKPIHLKELPVACTKTEMLQKTMFSKKSINDGPLNDSLQHIVTCLNTNGRTITKLANCDNVTSEFAELQC